MQNIVKAAAHWKQIVAPRDRVLWSCNACPFTTVDVSAAGDHALGAAGFPHVLFAARGAVKQGRRIHSPDGHVVLCMERD